MVSLGYKLCSEEHGPNDLVRFARMAEDHGFAFGLISDHFHPWLDVQGHSPFVWNVIGGIAHATSRLIVGTGVTCPTMRMHPVIVAQAAATSAAMLPGRFFLGVGTGENLNEHVVGARWPAIDVRRTMLEEAVAVIRQLWRGGYQDHHGRFFTVESARLYTLPSQPPPLLVAAAGPRSAELAGRIGDGLIATEPDPSLVERFASAGGGSGKPCYAELTTCWASDEAAARRIAHERWPIAALTGSLTTELPLPAHFQAAAKMLGEDAVARTVVCGPEPQRHVEAIQKYVKAGFDHVAVHQIGLDQEGFMRFYAREVMPRVTGARAAA
jgi:coenzyme F420-dependent glucose-6-phosphate dehydrogenase